MLSFTCGRQRCSHSRFQRSGTLLPHALALTDTWWVTVPANPLARKWLPQGLQGCCSELKSYKSKDSSKSCHWLSKGKITLKQPVPNPWRGHTDTDLIPLPGASRLPALSQKCWQLAMRGTRTLSIMDSSQQKGDNLKPVPSCQSPSHFAPKGCLHVKKPGIEGIGQ